MLEFNVDECLTRLRFGKYVWWAEKKCGILVSLPIFVGFPPLNERQGGEIVQLVLDHGKLKPPDICRLLQESASEWCKPFVSLLFIPGC